MNEKLRVVIVGAGYAGLSAALVLADAHAPARNRIDISLVDRNPYHLVKIRLHEAAPRPIDITHPLAELMKDRPVDLHQAAVTGVDLDGRTVRTTDALLEYDFLVLALGSVTNFFNIPGLESHAFALDSLPEAVRLRGHIEEQVLQAADSHDPDERARLLRFVVGGAGFTGIELAGELADHVPAMCHHVGLDPTQVQILVVDGHHRILPLLDEASSSYAAAELQRRGVSFCLGAHVTGCDAGGVTLDPGGMLPTATVVWTGGIRGNPISAAAQGETNRQGRLVVDATLRIPTYPEVYAVGDGAVALDPKSGEPLPATAQLAALAGEHAAHNILQVVAGRDPLPFDPHSRGTVVSIGHDQAVGWARLLGERQIHLQGLIGGMAKRASEAEWTLHLWRETHHMDHWYDR